MLSLGIVILLALLHHQLAATYAFSTPLSVDIFYDSSNYMHRDTKYHPECPDRIDHCVDALKHYFSSCEISNGQILHHIMMIDVAIDHLDKSNNKETETYQEQHSPLTDDEVEYATNILTKIHDPSLVTSVQNKCDESRQRRIDEEGKEVLGGWIEYIDGSDTYLTTESHNVGVRATGAWIRAVDAAFGIKRTETTKTTTEQRIGIALTRPPGHHATYSDPNGFCIYNFAMAAAAHALTINPGMKISILDWDIHFGQGIMDILNKCNNSLSESIRYVSLHQVPCFPYEGQTRKVQGRHSNVMTIPIQPESTWSCGYRDLFTTYALPFVYNTTRGDWEPDLVIVCAGYDGLDADDLASVNLVAKDYGEMTRLIQEHIVSSSKQTSLVFGLEGGYQLRDGVAGGNLADALLETIKALSVSQ